MKHGGELGLGYGVRSYDQVGNRELNAVNGRLAWGHKQPRRTTAVRHRLVDGE